MNPFSFVSLQEFVCQICEKEFGNLAELNGHYDFAHSVDSKYKCELCESLFRDVSSLYRHQRKMHGRKPVSAGPRKSKAGTVPCEICGKMFSNRGNVTKHVKTVHEKKKA